ncbi:glutathione synthetase [Novymonas esmeraldas]|uniref:glutathione synthase n=1 Tax=Novymonas esmeraldas TaxID=1808958 RepID=A0AAW0F6L9_9TRYP
MSTTASAAPVKPTSTVSAAAQSVVEGLPSEEELTAKCLHLGLVMRQAPAYNITHPALALRPLPMRAEVLRQLYSRQLLWNEAINRTARNFVFLRDSMRSTAESDRDFTGRLLGILERVYMTAPAGAAAPVYQPLMLGIFRTDYMRSIDPESGSPVSAAVVAAAVVAPPPPSDAVAAVATETVQQWKNIEINTISCSFAGLSPLVQQFHMYLRRFKETWPSATSPASTTAPTASVVAASPQSRAPVYVPDGAHNSAAQVPAALAETVAVWRNAVPYTHFLCQFRERTGTTLTPVVLVVVQENERNTADQYKLLLQLLESHGVRSLRRTLSQLHETMQLEHVTAATPNAPPLPPFAVVEAKYVAAVVYFRSTYVPEDLPTNATWRAREQLEEANAVKCPSIPYHLMTFKKMQQLMSNVSEVLTPVCFAGDSAKAATMAENFVPQYSLNKDDYARSVENRQRNDAGDVIDDPEYWIADAAAHPQRYVLKPQLEGGGNLIAGEAMQRMLRDTPPSDPLYEEIRREYILMRKIHFPIVTGALFRQNKIHVLENNLCSELGIFGVTLSAEAGRHLLNEAAGSVVRTKPADVDDGGVMAGVAALDSVQLIERPFQEKVWDSVSVVAGGWCPWRSVSTGGAVAALVATAATAAATVTLLAKRRA